MSTLLLKLLLLPPDLLRSHAQGYADLVREAGARYLGTLKRRWVLYMVSAASCFLASILGGVALLLWGAFSLDGARHLWLLPTLPLALLFVSGLCWWWASRCRQEPLMKNFQEQIRLDIVAIQQAQST